MNALEKIKKLEELVERVFKQFGSNSSSLDYGDISMHEVEFLLKAFNVMKEVAIEQAQCDQAASDPEASVEIEFEKRMKT